jgi:hypothetical protein
MRKNTMLVAVLCLAGTLPILSRAADEKAPSAADAKPLAAKAAGRLPSHFGKLVDKTQREKIYEIQTKYAEKIEDLQEQLKELMLQRDAEIRAVLTAEQQKKLDELIATVKSKSKAGKKAAAEEKAASESKSGDASN